jgi:hypothetical protein
VEDVLTSPISNDASSYRSIEKLIQKALGLTSRSLREQALAQAMANTRIELDEARRQASIGGDATATPIEVVQVMRAPKGVDRTAVVYHDGMVIKARLHPSGKRNPEREAAVWACIRDTAIATREQQKK